MKIYLLLPLCLSKMFITGSCNKDSDCASNCCGFNSGRCAGPIIAVQRDGGCGHGESSPNSRIARSMGFLGPFPDENSVHSPKCECK